MIYVTRSDRIWCPARTRPPLDVCHSCRHTCLPSDLQTHLLHCSYTFDITRGHNSFATDRLQTSISMSYTPDGAQSAPARVVPLPFAGGGNNTPSASRSPPRLGQSSRSGSRSLSMASKALLRSMDSSSGTSKQRRKLGIQDELRQQVDGLVKRRSGGVLGRG